MSWQWRNVPLPEFHLGGLAAGVVIGAFLGWALFPAAWVGHAIGWPLTVVGLSLTVWAVAAAGAVRLERASELVLRGPYAHSRNPMYAAWTLLYVGISFVINSAWPLVFLPAVLLFTHVQVLREERDLKGRFGAKYLTYMARTRRYV